MGREANACCMICEKTFSSLEAAERCENRHKEGKTVKKAVPTTTKIKKEEGK